MPLREIRRKFTTSELVILAWRSQEQSVQFKRKFRRPETELLPADGEDPFEQPSRRDEKAKAPPGVPAKYINADGEVDLRKMTGPQAWRYFASQGLQFPIIRAEE